MHSHTGTIEMHFKPWRLYSKVRRVFMAREEGQNLIEYALVFGMIALAATAGMSSIATDINTAFATVGTTLTTYIR